MSLYLIKILFLFIFSIFVGFNFYNVFPGHSINFDGYFPYIIISVVIYGIYKYIQMHSANKNNIVVSMRTIIFLFLTNLFVLCFYFFALSGDNVINGFNLFFKILVYSFLPIFIFIITTGFGKFVMNKIIKKDKFEIDNLWLLDLAIGFIIFVTLQLLFGLLGLYNLIITFLILIVFGTISYKEIIINIKKIWSIEYKIDTDDISKAKLFVSEFFGFLIFIILGISLISIVRPFPIGWDDLGVYMNFPNLMVQAGSVLSLGGMYPWLIFTGIGYMFNSTTQAFFVNISGLFLSFLVLYYILSDLLKGEKKTFLNLPIILSTIFISLPMVYFQTAKDIKVDEGLFFISIIALYFLYKYYLSIKEEKNISILYILLIGIIAGFAFSIKLTAILLIIGMLGVISYARFSVAGFLGYLGVFFGVFTLGKLWSIMNIVINPSNILNFERNVGIGLIVLGIGFFSYALLKKKKNISLYFKEILLFLLGVFIVLLPWFGKNLYEIHPNYSFTGIFYGKIKQFEPDYSNIFSDEEFDKINLEKEAERKEENLVTTNEDMLRYIGYDNGILNYVNIFWNLTMQKNQKGEYTNIGFLFFAFLPLIFIFLPYKKKYYFLFFVFFAIIQVLFYSTPHGKFVNSNSISSVEGSDFQKILTYNERVFENKKFNKDIYDIDVRKYFSKKDLIVGLSQNQNIKDEASFLAKKDNNINNYEYYLHKVIDENYEDLENRVIETFYLEIKEKVKQDEPNNKLEIFINELSSDDMMYIKYLHQMYKSNMLFIDNDIVGLKKSLNELSISDDIQKEYLKIWNNSRTYSGKISDFFAQVNFPVGYIYLLLGFLIPALFVIFGLKKNTINYLFKLNIVFACIYVFLWLLSSFGIVWYGITMYFSFLLMIGIGAYYVSSYSETQKDKKFFSKIIGSLIFLFIVLYYVFSSIFPYYFTNLKTTGYNDFKSSNLSGTKALFYYQNDIIPMIYAMNIDNEKRGVFLEESIDSSLKNFFNFNNNDISEVINLLKELEKQAVSSKAASNSLEKIYSGILNPSDNFKSNAIIYRAGTFLRYYISNNNLRVFDDSLLFNFSDYIYSNDTNLTIGRLKDLGIKYMLIDLNSATIDRSNTHDLTKRYEKLLSTFVSPKIELISTDSVCLQLALELYSKNKNIDEYMKFAGVNYESYDENGNQINRLVKRYECAKYIDKLIENKLINEDDFSFLLPYVAYFENKERNANIIDSLIGTSYKVLFEIK